MNGYLIRALVALVCAALLWAQARAAGERPHRRRAFELATGGLAAIVGYNATLAVGVDGGAIQVAVLLVGGVLLVLAAAELARSFFAGEMRDQRDRIVKAAQEYRERRAPNDKR
jgi:hypothetical protein